MHAISTECLYQGADELSLPFTVVAVGQDAIAKPMQEEDQRRNQLGPTEEEEAFYEILAKHPNAVQDFELIKELVKK